ncbi:MAG: alpha-amylase family protein, partial [Candidatus Colwellbacteria bacterium]|nr:alpha-amylase family protein [Candidatus Colwellbacteria bacterium]
MVDIWECLNKANVILVNVAPRAPPIEGHAGARRNAIYIIAASLENLTYFDIAKILIEEAIELSAKQRVLALKQPWTEDIAAASHDTAAGFVKDTIGSYFYRFDINTNIVSLWKILAEKNALSELFSVRSGHNKDRAQLLRERLAQVLRRPAVNNTFIADNSRELLQRDASIDAGELGKIIAFVWKNTKEIAVNFDEAYFEGDHIDIFYRIGAELIMVRIAPDYFVDYLTDTSKLQSFFSRGLRVDILLDSQEADYILEDLNLYANHPELYGIVYALNSENHLKVMEAVAKLETMLSDAELSKEARRLLTAALGIDDYNVQIKVQRILNKVNSSRPLGFPSAQVTHIAMLGEAVYLDKIILPVGFNPYADKEKLGRFKARLAVATSCSKDIKYYDLEVLPATDTSVRVKMLRGKTVAKAQRGFIHLAIQTSNDKGLSRHYSENEHANTIICCQPDLRGNKIYQVWPAYAGVYDEEGSVRYDKKGRATPGTFADVERLLPYLKKRRYNYIYVMGVYQLDRPENIKGQVGPDASLFSPLRFTVSRELGGEEGLRKLIDNAGRLGIGIITDIIPHVNQNFNELPEWAFIKARSNGRIERRHATDGSFNHEDGSPVQWHDSVMLNWRDSRVLEAYADLMKRLASIGVKGVRIDVAHRFGTMLPVDKSLKSKQKLFGHITSWDLNERRGYKVVNQWHGQEANPLLVYLVSRLNSEYPEFVFIGENYSKDEQLIKSGIIPTDAGTHDDLEDVILRGKSTQRVLNSHFRWLFSDLPRGAQLASALETHDYYRAMDRWQSYGPEKIRAAVWAWLATTRGPAIVYNR